MMSVKVLVLVKKITFKLQLFQNVRASRIYIHFEILEAQFERLVLPYSVYAEKTAHVKKKEQKRSQQYEGSGPRPTQVKRKKG